MLQSFRSGRLAVAVLIVFPLLSACSVRVPVLDRDATLKESSARLERLQAAQHPPAAPIDLPEAIARALMFNLDYRAARMSEAVMRADLNRSRFALWPQLGLGATHRHRDELPSSLSQDIGSGIITTRPTTSAEKSSTTAELQLSWNALDFGLGYIRAKQKGNSLLVVEEQRRKAFQVIVQDLTLAWWKAQAAQRVEPRLGALKTRVESALERSRQMEQERLQSPAASLDYRRDLLLSLKRLSSLQREILGARNDLNRLLALPPGATVLMQQQADERADIGWMPPLSREQLQRIALANRPELRELNYRQRIARLEGRSAWVALMPSIGLSAGPQYDTNKFLTNNEWNEASARLSFNLLNLAALPAARRYGKAAEQVESLRADAMTIAVLSQVSIALSAIDTDRNSWCLSQELSRVADEREAQYRARSSSLAGDELSQIRAELESLLAFLEREFSYAELQSSYALMLGTLGVDPYPAGGLPEDSGTLAEQLRSFFGTGLHQRISEEAQAVMPDAAPMAQESATTSGPCD